MENILVKSSRHSYRIVTGRGLIGRTGRLMKNAGLSGRVCIVTQRNIPDGYLRELKRSLSTAGFKAEVHYVPNGEKAKSEAELFRLYSFLLKCGLERGDQLVALGGGVVGDLAGYAAATYLRGIAFVNIATTLLAQVDSAIGGKTGINLIEGKNLVGAFYPPRLVLSDVGVLETLPPRELKAALAEVVKYGVIRDPNLFKMLEQNPQKIVGGDMRVMSRIVSICSGIKAGVVSRDEHERKGGRIILNYGHTFAHGFEKAARFRKMVHGEAVAVGMICAARLAVKLKLVKPAMEIRQMELLKALGLPVSVVRYQLPVREVLHAMMHDKKKKDGRLNYVLPVKVGKVMAVGGVPPAMIRKVLLEAGAESDRTTQR